MRYFVIKYILGTASDANVIVEAAPVVSRMVVAE